ncbi:MAG TPA: hypothetical protein VG650_00975 [Mycobacteriales bacterium]|nr:hypothetical protein [Mycobacteriales bacterium]
MTRRVLVAVSAASVVILGGCSGGSSGGGGGPASGTSIRGMNLPAFSCAARSAGLPAQVAPSTVTAVRVCPLSAPSPFNRPAAAITVRPADAGFAALVNALSLPDASSTRASCVLSTPS